MKERIRPCTRAKPIGQRHGGVVVTVPTFGREGPTQGSFSFVFDFLLRRGGRSLIQLIHFYLVVVNECTEALGYWNL